MDDDLKTLEALHLHKEERRTCTTCNKWLFVDRRSFPLGDSTCLFCLPSAKIQDVKDDVPQMTNKYTFSYYEDLGPEFELLEPSYLKPVEKCVTCQTEKPEADFFELECGHKFCLFCIDDIVQKSQECPFCRHPVEPE